jgi:uncharacterized LabA/DUF88 family protein
MKPTDYHSNHRVGIFIDVQNLYHSAKNLHHGRVNYRELMRHLTGNRQLIRALGYVVRSEGIVENLPPKAGRPDVPAGAHLSSEAAFFEALENAGIELRLKDIQVYAGGSKKADWDVGVAVDAIRMAPSLDVIVLVTGDGDFLPLVDYLKLGMGRLVEVAAFRRSASAKLQEAADKFINIEEIPKIIIRK